MNNAVTIDFGAGGGNLVSSCVPRPAGNFLIGAPAPRDQELAPINESIHQFDAIRRRGITLPRQLGLRPRVSVGAQRRVRRGPSLGESTPAGAVNSRGTLHALRSDRLTMTALSCKGWLNTPALASFTPSESSVLNFKIKSKNKSEEELFG